jgi:hypothetical protein
MPVFWDVSHHQSDDVDSKHLWNVGGAASHKTSHLHFNLHLRIHFFINYFIRTNFNIVLNKFSKSSGRF